MNEEIPDSLIEEIEVRKSIEKQYSLYNTGIAVLTGIQLFLDQHADGMINDWVSIFGRAAIFMILNIAHYQYQKKLINEQYQVEENLLGSGDDENI